MGVCSFQPAFLEMLLVTLSFLSTKKKDLETSKKSAEAQSIEIIAGIHLNLSNELTCKH